MDDFAANVAYEKAKSFVQKEEAIALAFKEYLLKNNKVPTLSDLVDNQFLNDGFSILNDFSKEIKITTILQDAYIENEINLDTKSITKFYDYYYSNNNRQHTLAPTTISSYNVKIKLSSIESFVLNNQASILVDILDLPLLNLTDKYYLKDGTLTWYDLTGTKKFTYNSRDIIIFGNEELSTTNPTIIKLLANNFLSVGSLIYMIDGDAVSQIMYLGQDIFKVMGGGEGIGETADTNAKLLITPYSGGYLLNGDIYTWGNNENRIITIEKDGVIPTPIRLKVKSSDVDISSQNYFSSPNRTEFIDFYVSVQNGTCAISENYELYCTSLDNDEILLNSIQFFDGSTYKSNKIEAYGDNWYVLVNGERDNNTFSGAKLFKYDPSSSSDPIQIDEENSYKDIKISYIEDYRRVFLLGNDGYVYILDGEINEDTTPLKVDSGVTFVKLKRSSKGVIATTNTNTDYYMYKRDNTINTIKIDKNDSEINSDSILQGTDLKTVWIDENNEIKGDYNVLDLVRTDEDKLDFAIKNNKWLKVKFIDEELVCAIDTNYQTYCWGKVGLDDNKYETIAIPIFNTNHFDSMVYDGDDVKDLKLKYPTYISGFNYDFEFK